MPISQRIVWIFAKSYIPRENSFLERKSSLLLLSPIIFMFGSVRIFQLYLLQKVQKKNIPDHLVVRSAAPHMHMKYFKLFNPKHDPNKYIFLDCFDKKKFTQIIKLNFWDIYVEFYLTFKELIPVLSKLEKKEGKKLILYEALVSLPIFAYFTCLFKNLKKQNPAIKIFSGGVHLISAAAIISSIPAYWLAHGLLEQAKLHEKDIQPNPLDYFIALPDYEFIYLYSEDEKKYLYEHGISSQIKLYDDYKKIEGLKNKILIFLIDLNQLMDIETLKMVIEFFQKYDYEIIMKFHPSYKGDLHLEFLENKNITINRSVSASASELVREEKPKFVASWASTTLCEALQYGIAPICLCTNEEEEFEPYPYKEKSIWWQEDQEKLSQYIDDTHGKLLRKFVEKINTI